jgi:flavin-dependent dehydrogenase
VPDVDVVIVGARVAGSALAIRLGALGRRVLLVDRARFPSDTMSTHSWGPEVNGRLRALGALAAIEQAGMTPIRGLAIAYSDVRVASPLWPAGDDDRGGSLRRIHLDTALLGVARATPGVDVVEGERVDVEVAAGRIVGVRGARISASAALVVGADGMRSTVAAAVGAEFIDFYPTQRFGYFAYWRGADPPAAYLNQFFLGEEVVTVQPADDGLWILAVGLPVGRFAEFRADHRAAYAAAASTLAPEAWSWFASAEIEGKLQGSADLPSFHRVPHGDGWALVGDAWCHKDPITALGIGDALLHAELLAPAIDRLLAGDGTALATAYAELRARTDPWHAWTCSSATPSPLSERTRALMATIAASEELSGRMVNVWTHAVHPQQVVSVPT